MSGVRRGFSLSFEKKDFSFSCLWKKKLQKSMISLKPVSKAPGPHCLSEFCPFLCLGMGPRPFPVNLKMKDFMEQLNRIELRGIVGNIVVQRFSDNTMARLTVATSYAYKDKNGEAVIDTSWHNVVAWEGKNVKDLSDIVKGTKLYVQGRLRYQKYTGSDGVERISSEILANRVVVIDDPEPIQYEL